MLHRTLKWAPTQTQLYFRDGTGNELASLEREGTGAVVLKEANLYGSERLGTYRPGTETAGGYRLNHRSYDLKDHLGNIWATVSDLRSQNGTDLLPTLSSASEYYPFGMESRTAGIGGRFGYNGKEKDLALEPNGGVMDFGARLYDGRIGRWRGVDPLAAKFPHISPFAAFNNNPIYYVDPDGRENVPALLWALKNMANKSIPSTYSDPYFAGSDSRWTYKIGTVPDRTVCYESCFMAYMNSGDAVLPTLRTGFTNKNNVFYGRSTKTGGMNWFKSGDGKDRQFVTEMSKGQLGDIVFMGEVGDMQGHAVLLASDITMGTTKINGVDYETATFYTLSTSSDSESGNYGGR